MLKNSFVYGLWTLSFVLGACLFSPQGVFPQDNQTTYINPDIPNVFITVIK